MTPFMGVAAVDCRRAQSCCHDAEGVAVFEDGDAHLQKIPHGCFDLLLFIRPSPSENESRSAMSASSNQSLSVARAVIKRSQITEVDGCARGSSTEDSAGRI